MEAKKIILFDGVCNLCNGAVQFIIKRDKRSVFKFASLQSEIGKRLTKERGIDTELLDSIILIEPGIAYYSKSTAALQIMKSFGGIWNLTRLFTVLPEGFRDIVYDFIAKNRYKWFGKKDACMIPTPELQSRFLD
ncbi:thiol-disulfide oxidoreductase DCC family protein [Flavobacterium sp. ASW18X]|uniref:thiol-disulfide oxidoreductase DCC family protein n=1 Tax=Flavobacterium sp. ASW18X TaxID=2572595 RepID=UPI0010ADD53E|nr:thiol-disulfide oxidoreductase DCC family protein [Flavobacterium sp. ASW18X]TKD65991.1 thiol-disulfide oxidoreductase DCC family protein [Flavobacterium sp. ASW18X]